MDPEQILWETSTYPAYLQTVFCLCFKVFNFHFFYDFFSVDMGSSGSKKFKTLLFARVSRISTKLHDIKYVHHRRIKLLLFILAKCHTLKINFVALWSFFYTGPYNTGLEISRRCSYSLHHSDLSQTLWGNWLQAMEGIVFLTMNKVLEKRMWHLKILT